MLLNIEDLCKQFNGTWALDHVNFSMRAGEVHGLVGENGAGKSTLIKILTGVYAPDGGRIFWDDAPVSITTPSGSRALGINVIHQDHVLIPAFTAVENVYLGMEYPRKNGHIDWKTMRRTVREKARELGISLELQKTAAQLSPQQKTCLEIVRAMMTECRLLILDEPTASLTDREAEILFSIIERLRNMGTSVLYVTHRMDEILRLTDRVTVLRNGVRVDTVETGQTSRKALISLMSDEYETGAQTKREASHGQEQLCVQHLASRDGIVKDVSFRVHAGEILGIFGIGGSGRTETLECIFGYRPLSSGEVELHGKKLDKLSPHRSIGEGMILISEDRRGIAMIGSLSVRENVSLSGIDRYARCGVIRSRMEREAVQEKADYLKIRMAGLEQRAIELSGGNQQKMVFARALSTDPDVYLCDEPTQAVDVMTRAEIHRLLREKAAEGKAIVFVSSDLKEVLEVADSIQIIAGGRSRELLKNEGLSSQDVLNLCFRDGEEPA